jgi:hypothetical protein
MPFADAFRLRGSQARWGAVSCPRKMGEGIRRQTRIEPHSRKRRPLWTASSPKTGPKWVCSGLVDLSTISNRSTFIGMSVGMSAGLVVGMSAGLLSGLVVGLGVGLFSGVSWKQLAERCMLTPNEGIRRSVKNGLGAGLGFILVGGLGAALSTNPVSGLVIDLILGLFFGLSFGLYAAVQHYALRFLLRKSFPWKAVPFLNNATDRVLLRRVGGGYGFTHRLLMDYFADLDLTASSESTNAQPTKASQPKKAF